jgi:hypothetical protein
LLRREKIPGQGRGKSVSLVGGEVLTLALLAALPWLLLSAAALLTALSWLLAWLLLSAAALLTALSWLAWLLLSAAALLTTLAALLTALVLLARLLFIRIHNCSLVSFPNRQPNARTVSSCGRWSASVQSQD